MTKIDDSTIDGLPSFVEVLYLHPVDQAMKISVLRGTTQFSATVPVTVLHSNADDVSDAPDLQRTLITELGMFVTEVSDSLKPLLHDDVSSGVVVVAPAAVPNSPNTGVQAGDIIRAINRTRLESVFQLQTMAREFKSGDAVVLQIERGGKLQYLAFEMD